MKVQSIEILRVKFRWPGKIYEFINPENLKLKKHDQVLVKSDRGGTVLGTVVIPPRLRLQRSDDKGLNPVLRIASEQDKKLAHVKDELRIDVKNTFDHRLKSKEKRGVKFVDCEKLDEGRRLVLYYQSENKDFDAKGMAILLAKKFNLKVDMRSVGIRDGAKLAGGIGKCGLSLCCSTWLSDFSQVSIRMAKDQGLSPDPEGITGQCGRLLCCLGYEHENYVELGKGLPKVGKAVITPKGEGRVVKLDILKNVITVKLENNELENFEGTEVKRKFAAQPKSDKKPSAKRTNNKNNRQRSQNKKDKE